MPLVVKSAECPKAKPPKRPNGDSCAVRLPLPSTVTPAAAISSVAVAAAAGNTRPTEPPAGERGLAPSGSHANASGPLLLLGLSKIAPDSATMTTKCALSSASTPVWRSWYLTRHVGMQPGLGASRFDRNTSWRDVASGPAASGSLSSSPCFSKVYTACTLLS